MATRIDRVNRAFALLIGIDDYSVYDASAGNPAGTSDLPASKNDVGSCYRICRALGIPPENIHVLTTPGLTPDDFGEPGKAMKPGYAGAATRAEIEAQVAWLAGVLAHAPGDADAPIGLLTYSGHGDFVDGFLALCPSDVRKGGAAATGDLEGALGFPRLQAILARAPGAAESLTVVIDCCHAAAADAALPGKPARRGARRSLTGRARAATGPITAIGDRMLMAAEPGQTAYQSTFDGRPHGALTWALSIVTDQWTVMAEGDVDRFTITHGELHARSQRLLDALGFSQQIALFPPAIASLPFFHRGAADAPDVVASAPDRDRPVIQLDPDSGHDFTLYTLTWTTSVQVLSVNHACDALRYSAGQEYWCLTDDFLNAFQKSGGAATSLEIRGVPGDWGATPVAPAGWRGNNQLPTSASSVSWTSITTPNDGTLYSNGDGIYIQGTPTAPTIKWYIYSSSRPPTGTYVVAPNSPTTFANTAPRSATGFTWYKPG